MSTDPVSTTDLIPSLSIDNLLQKREAIIARAKAAEHALAELQDIADVLYPTRSSCDYHLSVDMARTRRPFTAEAVTKEVDTNAWGYLLERSGLQSFLDAEAREKWRKAIEHGDVPPLTLENIQETFKALYATRGIMFERGVLEVFRKLSWDYKTNNPRMFGKKLILRYIVDNYGGGFLAGVAHGGADKLDDLTRVLSVLDGKAEPDYRYATYRRCNDIHWMRDGGPALVELDYFSLKGFKNGNGHLTFKRADLVDKLNQILAKHHPNALPPGDDTALGGGK